MTNGRYQVPSQKWAMVGDLEASVDAVHASDNRRAAIRRTPKSGNFPEDGLRLLCRGPLSQSAGNSLKDTINLCQYYGATESSNIPQLLPSRENWAHMEWHPACNIEMQPRDLQEGAYEMLYFLDNSTC